LGRTYDVPIFLLFDIFFEAVSGEFSVSAVTVMDQQASEQLARLWTESQPVVAAYILSIVPNFHQAEDVLQQVAVALVGEFERFDASRPFLPWALGIARNMALKSRRNVVRRWKHELSEALIVQIESAFQEQDDALLAMRQWLRYCLRKQPKKVLELLQWRYAHDLKPSEVAPRMGLTSGAVRAMLHRSREALRKCIRRNAQGAVEWI
jgi:RNA polymerase sigma-70 factor (ECF subfamily)